MRDFADTFHKKEIIWKRIKTTIDRYGEDTSDSGYDEVPLLVLCNYNYMRTWPITVRTETGGYDRQSMQILINKDYLRENGYLTDSGTFDYNPIEDMFELDGINYRAAGDTPISQNSTDDILFSMILKAEELSTGQTRGGA